jgi:cytochrome c biogenesis protein
LSWLYRFLRSQKLAVTLILILGFTAILATLIPQGEDQPFYQERYPSFLAWLIVATQFDNFYRSVLFLVPTALLFLSLAICTVDRLYKRIKAKARIRLGPDLIHLGLLLLMIGGVVTAFGRVDGTIFVGEGDLFSLPGGYEIEVLRYRFLQYENGRPKDWISTVRATKDGRLTVDSFPVEVNKPLELGPWRVYQASYGKEHAVVLKDPDGELLTVRTGPRRGGFPSGEKFFMFAGIEGSVQNGAAIFEEWVGFNRESVRAVEVGGTIDKYTVEKLSLRDVTGLTAVTDPGYPPVLVGLVLLGLGLTLTLVQKIGDRQI